MEYLFETFLIYCAKSCNVACKLKTAGSNAELVGGGRCEIIWEWQNFIKKINVSLRRIYSSHVIWNLILQFFKIMIILVTSISYIYGRNTRSLKWFSQRAVSFVQVYICDLFLCNEHTKKKHLFIDIKSQMLWNLVTLNIECDALRKSNFRTHNVSFQDLKKLPICCFN